jgi:hypothetical protein
VPLKQAVRVRIQTYRRGLESLCSAGPGLLFVGVEWNDELPTHQRLSSHRLSALRHLILAIESYCDARDERCLVVADEEETTTDEVVAVVREHQRSCADEGTLSRILDTPLFTQSHHSYGVQACDLAAFLRTRRALARPDEDARPRGLSPDCGQWLSRTSWKTRAIARHQRQTSCLRLALRSTYDKRLQMHEEPHRAARRLGETRLATRSL